MENLKIAFLTLAVMLFIVAFVVDGLGRAATAGLAFFAASFLVS